MATVSVSFDGTRVSAAESATDGGTWDKWGSSQAPSVEPDIVWQFGAANSDLSNKVGSGSPGGVEMDQSTGTHDFTTGHASGVEQVWLAKYWITNYAALNVKGTTGAILYLGTSNGDYYHWHSHGSDTYPAAGGWIFELINPNISGYRDGTTGTPAALSGVDYWGVSAQFTAASKSENVVMSAIDYFPEGQGLTLIGGDGASADAAFDDFAAFDEDTNSNRYGVVRRIPGGIIVLGVLTVGTSAADTVLTDTNPLVIFGDYKANAGVVGLNFDVSRAANVHTVTGGVFKGLGTKAGTTDTRPDHKVTGTAGTLTITGALFDSFRNWTLNSKCTVTNCTFNAGETIDAGSGADLSGAVLTDPTTAANASSIIWNVNLDPDGELDDITITKGANAHHAVEFGTTSPLTMTVRGMTATSFNATNNQNDSTFHVKRTSGTVTINVIGGTGNFSYRTEGATVNIVIDPVTTLVNVKDNLGANLQSARVLLESSSGTGDFPYVENVSITRSATQASVIHTTHGLVSGDIVVIRGANQPEYNGPHVIFNATTNSYKYTVSGSPATPATGNRLSTGQDETSYDNSPTTEGTFSGGTGHAVSDVLTLDEGVSVTVDAVSGGVVTQFTVDSTNARGGISAGDVLNQVSSDGSGVGFSLTPDTDNLTVSSSGAILSGTTNASGNISASRTFTAAQPVKGFVRKSTSSPRFKSFTLNDTISNTAGLTLNVRLVRDD